MVTKPELGDPFQKFLTKNNTDIVNKVILGDYINGHYV